MLAIFIFIFISWVQAAPTYIDIHYGAVAHFPEEYWTNRELIEENYRSLKRSKIIEWSEDKIHFANRDKSVDVLKKLKNPEVAAIAFLWVRTYQNELISKIKNGQLKEALLDPQAKYFFITQDSENIRIRSMKTDKEAYGLIYIEIPKNRMQEFYSQAFPVNDQSYYQGLGIDFRVISESEISDLTNSLRDPEVLGVIWYGHPALVRTKKDDEEIIVNSHLMAANKAYIPKSILGSAHDNLQFVSLATCHEGDVFDRYKRAARKNLKLIRPQSLQLSGDDNPLFSRTSMILGPRDIMSKLKEQVSAFKMVYDQSSKKDWVSYDLVIKYQDLKSSSFVYEVLVNNQLVGVLDHLSMNGKIVSNRNEKTIRFDLPSDIEQIEVKIRPNDAHRIILPKDILRFGTNKLIDDILIQKITFRSPSEILWEKENIIHLGDDLDITNENSWDIHFKQGLPINRERFLRADIHALEYHSPTIQFTPSQTKLPPLKTHLSFQTQSQKFNTLDSLQVFEPQLNSRPQPWTHFFMIAGDKDNWGAILSDEEIPLADQAWRSFEDIQSIAQKDKINNYVIFFDPLGSDGLLTSLAPQLLIYSQGKAIKVNLDLKDEIDSTRFQFIMQQTGHLAQKHLANFAQTQKSFYLYSEHIPENKKYQINWDYSHPKSQIDTKLLLSGLNILRKYSGRFELMILHSCYMNTIEFLKGLQGLTQYVLLDQKGIPNAKMELEEALRSKVWGPQDVIKTILKNNHRDSDERQPFELRAYQLKHLSPLLALVTELEALIDQEQFNQGIAYIEKTKEINFDWDSFGVYDRYPIHLVNTRELFVSLRDYIQFLQNFTQAPWSAQVDKVVEKIEHYLDKSPIYLDLREIISPLNTHQELSELLWQQRQVVFIQRIKEMKQTWPDQLLASIFNKKGNRGLTLPMIAVLMNQDSAFEQLMSLQSALGQPLVDRLQKNAKGESLPQYLKRKGGQKWSKYFNH